METSRALVRATAAVDMPPVIDQFKALLDLVVRVEIDSGIRILARTLAPPAVCSLDAIHLATALRLRDQGRLTTFVIYDTRVVGAASTAGLSVDMPAG